MRYNTPLIKSGKRQATAQFNRTTVKLPDTWRYGNKTKAQWQKAFEEEAKH